MVVGLDLRSAYKLVIFDLYSTMHTCAEQNKSMDDTENAELAVVKPFISNLDGCELFVDVEFISSIISTLLVLYYNTRVKERLLSLTEFERLLDITIKKDVDYVAALF